MKKFLTSIAMVLLLVGCAKEYDDSGLRELISALDTRVTALESNVQALQSAIGEGVFVAKVQEYVDPDTGKTIGVTVTYTNGDVKYFQIHPKDNTENPVLGVIKSGSGALVWAIDGVAILIDGEEVPVYQTPVFSLDKEGYLWVEVDGKKTQLGQVQNSGATLEDGIFTDIKVEQDKIILTLSDETTVTIPFAEAFKIELMLDECIYTEAEPMSVHYALTAATAGTVVRVAGYNPFQFSVAVNNEDKIIEITPLAPGAAATFLIIADSGIGLVSTATLVVEPEGLAVVDPEEAAEYDYLAEGNDGVVEAHVVSNVPFDVVPVDEWITVASIKAQAYTITLKLEDNKTEDIRTGSVNIVRAGTDQVLQTLVIAQLAAENEDGPANLSKKESANSYLVYAPGAYKFKAVKGNSEESVGTIANVEILWETDYSTEAAPEANSVIANITFANDYICFSTPETLKPGAAAIVAKDAEDVVLWTWLIWIPETKIDLIENAAFYGAPVMDRNLGAADKATTTDAGRKTYGMYYQWGRNNPLPGFMKTAAEFTKEDGPKSTAYAIANPTVFIKVSESDSAGNWNEEDLPYLWEDESYGKAIFDPCPPGYKVPSYNDATGLWTNGNDGWAYNWDANNYAYGDVVFPMAGWYSSGASVGYEAERSIILSATAHSSASRARLKIIRKDKSGYYYANYFKQEAASVRCIVVNEGAIVPPTPNPGGDEPGDTTPDLSEEGSANSYIVSEAGEYKFKAVKGNSEESVGTVATVEVLWETENTTTAPEVNAIIAAVGYADGYITFSTPETLLPGNAVIAAKDGDGTILWSWHIWIPADEIAVLDAEEFAGAKMLDRNLGALKATNTTGDVDPLSIGLYYQWGRKDPFPGATNFAKSPTGAAVAGTAWTYHQELITTEYSIQHPTEYASVPEVDAGVWNSEDPEDLWLKDGKKTIYDPCPTGYRVPSYNDALPMWKVSEDGWTFDIENGRCGYGDFLFSIAGYIDCWGASYAYSNLRTHIWTNKSKEATKSYCMYIRGDKSSKYYDKSFHKAKAGSVRCVAEAAAE